MKYCALTKRQRLYAMQHKTMLGVFTRVPNRKSAISGADFVKAGYPMAIPVDKIGGKDSWPYIHKWCRENLMDSKGRRTYTWTGERFWFTKETDRDKFAHQFCVEDA